MAKVTTTLYGDLALLLNVARVPLVETLEFLTDGIEHYDGSEQHIQLRSMPRQSFKQTLVVKPSNDSDAFNTLWGAIRSKWAIPVWSDAQTVGIVALDSTFILCDTTNYDLRPASLALLFDGCGGWQVVEITTFGEGGVNLSANTKAFRNAMLIPLRIGMIKENASRPTNGFSGEISIDYAVQDNKLTTPSAPDQYLGEDIYLNDFITNGEFNSHYVSKRQDITDFDLGKFEQYSPWIKSKNGKVFRSLMFDRAEITTFKNFFNRRLGKFRKFWMPSFENNIRLLNTGTVVSTLLMNTDSYIPYAIGRTNIAIQANGAWYVRTLSTPTPLDATTMQITLSSALNLPASSISRVCYLGLFRLDTDRAEINYSAPLLAECALTVLEVGV